MSNGEHNDAFPWRYQLEKLDSLPGEAMMDKAAAWEKLNARLHGKSRRRYAAWYWSAAAVALLAVLLTPVVLLHKQKEVAAVPPPAIAPAQPDPAKVVSPVLTKKVEVRPGKKAVPQTQHMMLLPQPGQATGEALAAIPPAADTTQQPVISRPIPSFDSMLARVTTAPVKKKMRVVHINELNDAATGQAAADLEYKPFKIKFNNPSGFASQTIVNNTAQPERPSKN